MNQALPRNGDCYATVVMVDISPVDMQFLLCTPRGDDFSGNPTSSLTKLGFLFYYIQVFVGVRFIEPVRSGRDKSRPYSKIGFFMIHIYTGNGKGKTTAAVGQVIRALGRGWNIAWIQYCKDVLKNPSGEILILRKLKIPLYHYAPKIPLFNSRVKLSDIKKDCLKSLNVLKQLFNGRYYDLIVLDELNVAIAKGFLPLSKILLLLQKKPSSVEIIITGRGKHKRLVQIADLVTEMKEIKHPFNKGIKARRGIEF